MAVTETIPSKALLNKNKLNRLIMGVVLAFVFFGLLSAFVFFIQTRWFPVKSVKAYLVNTNYVPERKDGFIQIEPKEETVFFEFLIPEVEKDSRILLFNLANNQADIFINNQELLFQDAKFSLKPNGTLLAYDKKDILYPIKLDIVINPGGRLVMEDFPMIGQEENLKINAQIRAAFKNFIFILVGGMGLLLSFIFIPIALKERTRLKVFLPVGIVMLYYGVFSCFIYFSYGSFTFFSNEVNVWVNLLLGYFSSNLLFAGLEYYFFNEWKMTKILLISNISLFLFFFILPEISLVMIVAVNFFFFALLGYRSNMLLFNFLIFTSFASEIFSMFAVSFFPYWQMDLDGISMFIMLFGVGYFFILDFNKQNELLKEQSNELQVTNEQMYAMNEALKDEYIKIERIKNGLEDTIKEQAGRLRKTMNSMKTLLNNTGEGFLKFDETLLIEPEYSAECKKIFCRNIDLLSFPELITNGSTDDIEMTTKILKRLLKEEEPTKMNALLALLPGVIQSCNKVLSLKYKVIEKEEEDNQMHRKIMVIINDITQEITLQNKLKAEKVLFEAIVKLLAHYDEFQTLVDSYKTFWEKEHLDVIQQTDVSPENKRDELLRTIHTFKGNFAGFGLKRICRHLDNLESQLEKGHSDYFQLFEKIRTQGLYLKWLEKDLKKVHDYIHPHILQRQKVFKSEREAIKQVIELLKPLEETEALNQTQTILQKLQ